MGWKRWLGLERRPREDPDEANDAGDAGEEAWRPPPRPLDHFGRLDDPGRLRALQAFLEEIAPSVQEGRVVPRPNDNEVDLLGKIQGCPLRIEADTFPRFEITLKASSEHGFLDLEFDPKVDPSKEPPVDPEWGGTQRVFVGKSVFFEGDEAVSAGKAFAALPDDFRRAVVAAMGRERIRYYRMRPDETWALFWDLGTQMADPKERLESLIKLMSDSVTVLHATPAAPAENGGSGVPSRPVTCSYCRASYFVDAACKCPHCGAPFSAA